MELGKDPRVFMDGTDQQTLWLWTFDFVNCGIVNSYCFKLLGDNLLGLSQERNTSR